MIGMAVHGVWLIYEAEKTGRNKMRVISVCEVENVTGGATVNGCTGVPDRPFGFNFKPACDDHDRNYSTDSTISKVKADQQFKADMLNICETKYDNSSLCRATAQVYYLGVSMMGSFFYQGSGGFSSSGSDGGGFSGSGFSF